MCCTSCKSKRIPSRLSSVVVTVLAVLLLVPPGAGALSFEPRLDLTVGTAPLGVGIGDIDGDGKQDLVVAAHEDDTVAVFLNTGSAGALSFAPKIDVPTGLHPQGVAVVDLDKDGKPDIVTANSGRGGGGSMSVLLNTSSPGAISFALRRDFPVDTAHRVAVGDLDGDGRLDLAVSANSPRRIDVFRNLSSPGSLSLSRVLALGTASFPNSVAVADIDGDGRPEILAPITDVDSLAVYSNQSTAGSFSFASPRNFGVGDSPNGIDLGDFNGDGRVDVVVGNGLSDSVSLLLNESSPGSIALSRHDFSAGTRPTDVAVGDLDGDGTPDVVAVNRDDKLALLRASRAEGSVSLSIVEELETAATPIIPEVSDLDGDGALDIAVGNHEGATASVFRNAGSGFLSFPLPDLGPFTAPVSAILDHSIATGYYCQDTHVRDDGCEPPPPRVCSSRPRAPVCFLGGDGLVRAFTGAEARSEFLRGRECSSQCSEGRMNCRAALTSCGYPRASREPFSSEDLGGINYVGVTSLGGPVFLQYDGHSGYDYPAPRGTPILAPSAGQLVHVFLPERHEDPVNGDGRRFNTFKIVHLERDGFVYETWFLHAERNSVVEEGEVIEGQQVAEVGWALPDLVWV